MDGFLGPAFRYTAATWPQSNKMGELTFVWPTKVATVWALSGGVTIDNT